MSDVEPTGSEKPQSNETDEPPTDQPPTDEPLADGFAGASDETVTLHIGNQSVLKSLEGNVPLSRIALKDVGTDVGEPLTQPNSAEMPEDGYIGRYHLLGEIARGGMGAILRGRDTDLGRDLAVKVLLETHADRPDVIQRFIEEAQINGQLQHPGIAPVYELGQFADKRPFFTMKLVKGKTLSELLTNRSSPKEDQTKFLGIFEQVCLTLAYAHSRGVIHRDLKPSNIMVGTFGEVQLMDWGLAKVLASGGVADEKKAKELPQADLSVIRTVRSEQVDTPGYGSETHAGSVLGTPAYMAPEQALGEVDRLDERVDVFGLGALLCEILTGRPPYQGESGKEVFRLAVRAKLDEAFDRLEKCEADRELIELTKTCLSAEPTERARDAGVLAGEIAAYFESVQTRLAKAEKAAVQAEARADEERKRRSVTMALTISMMFIVLLGAGSWTVISTQNADHERQVAERQSRLVDQIKDEITEAQMLRLVANADFGDERPLLQAQQAVARADALAQADLIAPELLARINQLESELDNEVKDRRVVAALQKARTQRIEMNSKTGEGPNRIANLYRLAFAEYGIQIGNASPKTIAELMSSRRDFVRDAMIAALDDLILLAPRGLGIRVESSGDEHIIAAIFDGSVAAASKSLSVGDRIVAIVNSGLGLDDSSSPDVISLVGKTGGQVAELLKGELGSSVTLYVSHAPKTSLPNQSRSLNLDPDIAVPRMVELVQQVDTRAWLRDVALRVDPDPWRIQFRVAVENMQREELLKLAASDEATKQTSSSIVSLAMALVEINEQAEGVRLLKAAQRRHSDDFWINYTLGVQLHRSKPPKYRDAIRFYTAALAIRPQAVGAGLNLGDAYEFAGELDDAIASYRKVTDARPDDPDAWMSLGNALAKRTDTEEQDAVNQNVEFNSESDQLFSGVIKNEDKDRNPNQKAFPPSAPQTRDFQIKPEPGNAKIAAADASEESSKLDGSKTSDGIAGGGEGNTDAKTLTQIPNAKGSRTAQRRLGSFNNRGQQFADESVKALEKSVRLNPDSFEAQCLLGKALQRKGQYNKAISFFRKGDELAKKNGGDEPTEKWLKEAQALASWGQKLHALVTKHQAQTYASSNESYKKRSKVFETAQQARTCMMYRRNAAAVGSLYSTISDSDSELASDLAHGHRLAAARTLLYVVANSVNAKSSASQLRKQAAEWLGAELDIFEKKLKTDAKDQVAKILKQLKNDPWFRNAQASAKSDEDPLKKIVERINQLSKTAG
jgi:serine/threonine protein kinase/Flp pilus assembly protein TadD